MQIDKSQLLDLLKSQGQGDTAQQAESQLPDTVDTDQHSGLLQSLGIDLGKLGGLENLGSLGGLGKLL